VSWARWHKGGDRFKLLVLVSFCFWLFGFFFFWFAFAFVLLRSCDGAKSTGGSPAEREDQKHCWFSISDVLDRYFNSSRTYILGERWKERTVFSFA